MAGGKKRKTQFIRLPELEQALQSAASASSTVPVRDGRPGPSNSAAGRRKGQDATTMFMRLDDASIETIPSDLRSHGRRRSRRDSNASLFEPGQAQADIDADFIAKYDRLTKPTAHEEILNISNGIGDKRPHTSYAAAANTEKSSSQENLALYDVCPPSLPSATDLNAPNDKAMSKTIGHDMTVVKKAKRTRTGNQGSKFRCGNTPKQRSALRLEDDVDRGFSVTGHRRFNAHKFDEHWQDALPMYYK